jgi:hypothetical protein
MKYLYSIIMVVLMAALTSCDNNGIKDPAELVGSWYMEGKLSKEIKDSDDILEISTQGRVTFSEGSYTDHVRMTVTYILKCGAVEVEKTSINLVINETGIWEVMSGGKVKFSTEDFTISPADFQTLDLTKKGAPFEDMLNDIRKAVEKDRTTVSFVQKTDSGYSITYEEPYIDYEIHLAKHSPTSK